MNKNRNNFGQFCSTDNIIDWKTINFFEDYVPYYLIHTRSETIKFFNNTEATHKIMCRYYNYKKSWNSIHKTQDGNIHTNKELINTTDLINYYNNHTRKETTIYFNLSVSQLKELLRKNNYKRDKNIISKNIISAGESSGHYKWNNQLKTIDFWNEYVPFFEQHTREETCDHFGLSISAHKKFTTMYDYHKDKHLTIKQARKKVLYNNIYFDSFPEVAYFIWAKDHNKNIIFEPCKLYYKYNNTTYTYYPDFEVDGELIEIKGDHFFKKDGTMCNPFNHTEYRKYEAKYQCMIENNVKILRNIEYNFAINYCIITYGDNWIDNLKIKKIKKEDRK